MERQEFTYSVDNNQLFRVTAYQICLICDKDERKKELGTGFLFLRNDWIVTAAHVVLVDGISRMNLFAKFPNQLNDLADLKVIAIHHECDIALLQIVSEQNPCEQPLFPGYTDLSVSRGLVICGYTPSKGNIITFSLAHSYSKDYRLRERMEFLIEFESNDIEGGSSGGPIFADGGVVVGIVINQVNIKAEEKKIARATSIKNLMNAIMVDYDRNIMVPVIKG